MSEPRASTSGRSIWDLKIPGPGAHLKEATNPEGQGEGTKEENEEEEGAQSIEPELNRGEKVDHREASAQSAESSTLLLSRCLICDSEFDEEDLGTASLLSSCRAQHDPCCKRCLLKWVLQPSPGVKPACPICRAPSSGGSREVIRWKDFGSSFSTAASSRISPSKAREKKKEQSRAKALTPAHLQPKKGLRQATLNFFKLEVGEKKDLPKLRKVDEEEARKREKELMESERKRNRKSLVEMSRVLRDEKIAPSYSKPKAPPKRKARKAPSRPVPSEKRGRPGPSQRTLIDLESD